jgi:acylphosphatase
MKAKEKAYHVIIVGDVQGVGYRSWMKREANALGVVGWVKNREDDAVESIIQGDDQSIKKLIEKVKIGPEVAWVKDVEMTEHSTNKDLYTFEVVY